MHFFDSAVMSLGISVTDATELAWNKINARIEKITVQLRLMSPSSIAASMWTKIGPQKTTIMVTFAFAPVKDY